MTTSCIEWTVETESSRAKARLNIEAQRVHNETLPCSVPGCHERRRGISSFCKAHQHFHQDRGHPILRMPVGEERRWMLDEGEKMLEWLRAKHGLERVDAWLKAAAREINSPPSMAIPPRKIEKNMTQRTRAGIVLAWYLHKRRLDPLDIVKLYLAAELYTLRNDLVFGPRVRNGFTNRTVGQIVAKCAKVQEDMEVYQVRYEELPSWANERYKRVEEVTKVTDRYKPQTSVYKMLGKMIREVLSEHSLLACVRDYYEHLLRVGS